MKKAIFVILLIGLFHASGSPDTPSLYIVQQKAIVKPPTKADIQFDAFRSHLRLVESSGDYTVINSLGCIGAYQFTTSTLEILGYHNITPERFKADPSIFNKNMQDQAIRDLVQYNEKALKKFTQYIGQVVNGVLITRAGLLAATHLGGIGSIKRFFDSNHNASDINGTSIIKYLTEFSQFTV